MELFKYYHYHSYSDRLDLFNTSAFHQWYLIGFKFCYEIRFTAIFFICLLIDSIQNWIEDLYWKQLDGNYPGMPDAMVGIKEEAPLTVLLR